MISIIVIGIYVIACFVLLLQRPVVVLTSYFVFTLLQNITFYFLKDCFDSGSATIFLAIKDVFLYIALLRFLYTFIRRRRCTNRVNALLFIVSAVYVIAAVVSTALSSSSVGLGNAISALRQLLLPIAALYVGFFCQMESDDQSKLIMSVICLACIVAVFGFIELLFLGDKFWLSNGLLNYFERRGQEVVWFTNEMPAQFYTWDYFNRPIRRMTSFILEPLASAHIMYLGLVMLACHIIYSRRCEYISKRRLTAYVIGFASLLMGCVLSFSKAIYIGIFLLIALVIIFINKIYKNSVFKKLVAALIAVSCLIIGLINSGAIEGSALYHVQGLIQGIASAGIFGNGVGTAGFNAMNSVANESYIGTLAYQIGYLGLGLFISIFVIIYLKLIREYELRETSIVLACIVLLPFLLVDMLFSESAVSSIGTSMFFVLIGLASRGAERIALYRCKAQQSSDTGISNIFGRNETNKTKGRHFRHD